MSTITTCDRQGNGLALLANKCASRTFDISSGMVYASMRDQIVRAQLLVRDLKMKDPECKSLLIIGAGVAGVTAACYANELGIEAVVLESADEPFSLQAGVCKRMVGPFMYEWPNIVAGSQAYPLEGHGLGGPIGGTPSWKSNDPISANDLANQLKEWLKERDFKDPKPKFFYGVNSEDTRAYVLEFVNQAGEAKNAESNVSPPQLLIKKSKTTISISAPNYIILAVGMGTEQTKLVEGNVFEGTKFWADDDFRDSENMDWSVGVFGGGDGALQDILRLTTRHSHPLGLINALTQSRMAKDLAEILPQLDSLEQQSRLLATWSAAPVYDLIDQRCKEICVTLVKKADVAASVQAELREGSGTVSHVFSGQCFDKAYLLNRFCVHLIAQCQEFPPNSNIVKYLQIPGGKAVNVEKNSSQKYEVKLNESSDKLILDRIAVRFGPGNIALKTGQLIQLSDETLNDRVSMSAIPLPYVVAH